MSEDPTFRILLYATGGFFLGIYLFYKGIKKYKLKSLIENTPTSKVRSIAMGQVEVFGKAISPEGRSLKSPFTEADCVYYKYTVEEYKSRGKTSRWVLIDKKEERLPFYLEDDTGFVLVDPNDAEIDIPVDFEYSNFTRKEIPKKLEEFMKSKHYSFPNTFLGMNVASRRQRFREYYIAQSDNVYIMGNAGRNPYRTEGWSQKNEDDIMIQKGKDKYFYISDTPEKEVLEKLRIWAYGGVFGGTALSLFCLFIIFAVLKML